MVCQISNTNCTYITRYFLLFLTKLLYNNLRPVFYVLLGAQRPKRLVALALLHTGHFYVSFDHDCQLLSLEFSSNMHSSREGLRAGVAGAFSGTQDSRRS